MNHEPSQHDAGPKGFWGSRYAIGLIVMGAVAAYFLLSEHRAHFFGALPFLLVLACPLMHVFMHHGHGGHGAAKGHRQSGASGPNTSTPQQANKNGEQP